MALVVGNIALIMTKCLNFDIAKAKSWFSVIILSENSKDQLKFSRGNLNRLNLKRIFDQENCTKIIYSDASSSGFAGYEVSTINGLVHGMWSPDEKLKSSTWRELLAVNKVLMCIAFSIKHHKVKWYTDNASVCSIISKGSMKTDPQNIALDIFSFCVENCVILDVE